MPDDNASEAGNLRQALAALEAQQREFGLNLSAQIAELQRRLAKEKGTWQSSSRAASTTRGAPSRHRRAITLKAVRAGL